MTDLGKELAALAADLRATLLDYDVRGARSEAADAEPVAGEAPDEAWLARFGQEPEDDEPEEEEEEAVPAAGIWDQVATSTRAARTPKHHDDGLGIEGLHQIRADLGDCTRCRLCEGRTQIVFGVGDAQADLMVIGEGPGEHEDRQGEPFVGPAGQMLDKMLEHVIGLPRPKVYIANIVKCRPPDNRNPEPDEAATCKTFLHRQIAAIQPRVILVLGSVAMDHLLGLRGITRQRGKEASYEGILAIPTFHPAYLLRKPEDKRLVFEDLKLVKRRYDELGGRR